MSGSNQKLKPNLRARGHVSAVSIDTNASGIAESTISLGLSRFPEPPASIPSTPSRSEFGNTSPVGMSFPPLQPRRKVIPNAQSPVSPNRSPLYNDNPFQKDIVSKTSNSQSGPPQASSSSHILSPYDWHDGASSIGVDATEGRLLPTSFITSLLQENNDTPYSKRTSHASEALSGISEMTYPPVVSRQTYAGPSLRHQEYRAQDTRPPPSAWNPGDLPIQRLSGDSETLHSTQGYPSIVRTASVSRVQVPGANVVGIAPATLRSISASSQISQDTNTLRSFDKRASTRRYLAQDEDNYLTIEDKPYNHVYSPALPSTAGTQRRFLRDSTPLEQTVRNSFQSDKSAVPSFVSRMSSLRRMFTWRKVKPLPPVPIIPHIPVSAQNEHRRIEESTPLPDLANRAEVLHGLLEKGYRPHDSLTTYRSNPVQSYSMYEAEMRKLGYSDMQPSPPTTTPTLVPSMSSGFPLRRPQNYANNMAIAQKRRKLCFLISVVVIIIITAVGAGVGASVGKKKHRGFSCSGNFTGSNCLLDATCVCTSPTKCNGLAQSLIDLVPAVNQAFNTNLTSARVYNSIWMMQGNPANNSCATQALLVDVGVDLEPKTFPNRTQWAQAALLWNAIQTQDVTSATKMQASVQKIPWKDLGSSDGPIASSSSAFVISSSGFIYDFATQTLGIPPASFVTLGQPSNVQISRVSTTALSTLDRMYSFAQASSVQRQSALKKYWSSVLQQQPQDLDKFKAILSVAPILLPFNASSRSIRNLYANTPTTPFPPPLSCYPNLLPNLQQQLSTVETTVFGLPNLSNPTQFDPTCYHDRPIYGILDVLGLRLPHFDNRTGVPQQGAILTRDANSRVILYNGEMFSGSLNVTNDLTTLQLDGRQYGVPTLMDHVLLRYLTSIQDVNVAIALASFVLASASQILVPPTPSSLLYQAIPNLPTLEVAVFGDVPPSDLTSTISPFTLPSPSNTLFFGSTDASFLRNWTINTVSGPIIWTQNSTSPLVVRDRSLGDTTITQTWNAISDALTNNIQGIGLANITSTFIITQDFQP